MKVSFKLSKTIKDSLGDDRTSVYIWRNLDHLTDFYSDVVDSTTINTIAEEIKKGQKLINNQKYKARSGLTETMNESCLCNLVEMELLNRPEVLDKFLDQPIPLKK